MRGNGSQGDSGKDENGIEAFEDEPFHCIVCDAKLDFTDDPSYVKCGNCGAENIIKY